MLKRSAEAIDVAVKNGLPGRLRHRGHDALAPRGAGDAVPNAIEHGAHAALPLRHRRSRDAGRRRNLIQFTRNVIAGMGVDVGIDWHGHNDRGLGVRTRSVALEFGADRVHGTASASASASATPRSIRSLLNLKLLGELPERDLTQARSICRMTARRRLGVPIPSTIRSSARDAFRTATGVHAAAIIKAEKKGDAWLADRIYSGVPAGMFGREQEIEIGHMSGESNVIYWLRKRHIEPDATLVKQILGAAKATDHLLTEDEVQLIIKEFRASGGG